MPFATLVFHSLLFFLLGASQAFGASGITYHGRLMKPDGTPVLANVQFRLQIRTPGNEDCLMYEEIQTQNLSTTSGMFALSLGDGGGVRQDSNTWNMFDALSNRKAFSFAGADCSAGNSFAPNPTDNRKFRVFFNDGTFAGWEALPLQTINFIPMAIESYAVGGFPASSLLRVENAGTLVNTSPLNNAQYTEFLALLAGTSNQYTKAGQLNGSTLPALAANQSVRWTGAAWQAFTPLTSETDPNVSAFAKAALPTCAAGEVLKSDGTSLSCVTDTGGSGPGDATTAVKGVVVVPAAGGLSVSSGSLSLPDVVTANTYTKVTVDAKGRVTTGAALAESDIPQLTSSGNGVLGGAITSGTIGGTTAINTSGNLVTSGSVSAATVSARGYRVYEATNTHYVSIESSAGLGANYSMVLPATNGTANQVLGMNNAANGMEYKSITAGTGVTVTHSAGGIQISATGSGGTVTSVTGTAPISVDNTDPTQPVVSLANSGVSANTYGSATQVPVFAVDAKGRVTSVTNTTITGVSPAGSTLNSGEIWIGSGGNVAAANAVTGDLTLSNAGVTAVTKIRSVAVNNTAPSGAGQLLRYDGTEYKIGFLGVSDLRSTVNTATNLFPVNCTAGQTLVHSSLTDTFDCTNIAIAGSAVTNTAAGNIAATNVQAAINELDTEKVAKAGDTMTGALGIGGAPNASALLDVASTTKGVLIPRMTEAQRDAIATPAAGLQVYNTDDQEINYYNGTAWQALGVAGSGMTSLNGLTGSTQTFATPGTTGTAPNWASATNAHTLHIPMASGAGVTAGLISKTEYDAFTNKGDIKNGGNTTGAAVVVGTNDAQSLQFETNDAVKMTILSDGKVGIGTVTPEGSLHIENPSSTGSLTLRGAAASGAQINLDANGGNTNRAILQRATGASGNMGFRNASSGTMHMVLDTSGNLAIGTTSPQARFHSVNASSKEVGRFTYVSSNTSEAVIRLQKARGSLGSEAIVNSGDSLAGIIGQGYDGSAYVNAGALLIESDGTPGANDMPGRLSFWTTPDGAIAALERMRIDSNGNVGIGTSAPDKRLTVKGSGNASQIHIFGSGTANAGGFLTSINDNNAMLTGGSEFDGTNWTARATNSSSLALGGGDVAFYGNSSLTAGNTYNPTELMRIKSSGNVGIGTASPSSKLDVAGTIQVADGGEICSAAADGGMIRYNGGNLQFCNESSWQTLGISGAGMTSLNGQTGSTQTFAAPGTTGTAPNWASASNAHTLHIPMASGAGVTAGLISKTDYDAFNAKLGAVAGSTLNSGQIWVGNGSNQAAAVSVSGDVTLSNAGAVAVTKIRGVAVNSSAPTTTGQILKYNSAVPEYAAGFIGLADIRSTVNTANNLLPTTCTASQTMTYSAVTDTYSCAALVVASANITDGTIDTADLASSVTDAMWTAGSGNVYRSTGNVGVGATSPDYKFHVKVATAGGDGIKVEGASGTSSTPVVRLTNGATPIATFGAAMVTNHLLTGTAVGDGALYTHSTNSLIFGTNATERMRILSGGNVGIGTTNPATALDVNGVITGGSSASQYLIKQGGANTGLYIESGGALSIYKSGTRHLTADNGYIGIGTASPAAPLDVGPTNAPSTTSFRLYTNGSDTLGVTGMGNTHIHTTTADATLYTIANATSVRAKVNAGVTNSGYNMGHDVTILRNQSSTSDNGTLSELIGQRIQYGHYNSDATATPVTTTAYGLLINPLITKGTITNMYDLYIGNGLTGGTVTNRYGVYQSATAAKNYFAGTVGIGTTSPTYLVHLFGSANDGTSSGLQVQNTSTGTAASAIANFKAADASGFVGAMPSTHTSTSVNADRMVLASNSDATGVNISAGAASQDIRFFTGGPNERMRIDSSGNVGIGTNNPTTKLEVNGTIKATAFDGPMSSSSSLGVGAGTNAAPSLSFTGDTDTGFYNTNSDNTISVTTGGTKIFDFTSNGLTSPTTGGALIKTGNGDATTPTFSFAGDPDTGWFRPAADTLAASTGGTEKMRIASSGNVSIGTTGAAFKLNLGGTTTEDGIKVELAGATSNNILIAFAGANATHNLYTTGDAAMYAMYNGGAATNLFHTAGNSYINGGNLGLGTSSPASKLDVRGLLNGGFGAAVTIGTLDWDDVSNSRPGQGYTLLMGTATNGPGAPTSYFHPFNFEFNTKDGSGNITQLAIPYGNVASIDQGIYMRGRYSATWSSWVKILSENTSGRVGIGSTSPATQLHVLGAGQTTAALTNAGNRGGTLLLADTGGSTGNGGALLFGNTASWFGAIKGLMTDGTSNTTGDIAFSTRNAAGDAALTERMRILAGGNVGIGTTAPVAKLDVNGTIKVRNGASDYYGIGETPGSDTLDPLDLDYNRAGAVNTIFRINHHTGISMSAHSSYGGIRFYNQGYQTGPTNPYLSNLASAPTMVMAINNGRVGIGTTAGDARLDVKGTSNAMPATSGATQSAGLVARFGDSSNLVLDMGGNSSNGFWLQSVNRALLSTNYSLLLNPNGGSVGIGTTSPSARLHILGSGTGAAPANTGTTDATINSRTCRGSVCMDVGMLDSGAAYIQPRQIGDLSTNTGLLLNPNGGNVGIGTTNPSQKLHVVGHARLSTGSVQTQIQLDSSTGSIAYFGPSVNGGLSGGITDGDVVVRSQSQPLHLTANNTPAITILTNGNVGIGTTSGTAKLDVNGTTKLGASGTAITNMGACTIASTAISTAATNYTCTGVPASASVAVHCNGTAAMTTPATTALYCRAAGTANTVTCNTTAANAVAMTWVCMWIQP